MDSYEEEMEKKMSTEDKKKYGSWRKKCDAEEDARTLVRYGELKMDSKRIKLAKMALEDKLSAIKAAKEG